MLPQIYPISIFLICLSLAACQPTVSGLKPIPQPSVSASAPDSIETPKPTPKPSSLRTPRPTAVPIPEAVLYSGSPVYLDMQHDTYNGKLSSNLFLSNNQADLIWSFSKGQSQYLNRWTEENYFSFSTENNYKPSLILSHANSSNKGIIVERYGEGLPTTLYDNPVYTQAISFEGHTLINRKSWAFLQVHDLAVTNEGNGYILFSDERPPLGDPALQIEYVSIYAAKVENFIPSEPQKMFTTSAKNRTGNLLVHLANVDTNGSGLVGYLGEDSKFYLQRFEQLKLVDTSPLASTIPGMLKLNSDHKNGFYYAIQSEKKPYKLSINQIVNLQPVGTPQSFNINPKPVSIDNTLSFRAAKKWALKLDENGNGLLVNVQRDSENHTDILELTKIEAFQEKSLERFVYPAPRSMADLQLSINQEGNGKLYFVEGICTQNNEPCTLFSPEKSLRIAYLPIQNFALK